MKMTDGTANLIAWYSTKASENHGFIEFVVYRDAAAGIGLKQWQNNAQFFGQLQSRVDFACYKANLPPLGLTAEKAFDDAWSTGDRAWTFPVKDMSAAARRHRWTSRDFLMITAAATSAPASATNAWAYEFSHNETAVRDWAERFAGFPQRFSLGRPINYWWVNQNQTYKAEVQGGFLWSPKTRIDGARNKFYDNMGDVRPGDIIFSFCDTRIKAVGIATAQGATAPKPHVHGPAEGWASEGWHVPVKFHELEKRIRPKDYIKVLRAHLPSKYSPLQDNGDGLQSVYLAGISDSFAHELIKLIGQEYHNAIPMMSADICFSTNEDDAQQQTILGRTDIGATTKSQLIEARRGQGIFKSNVRLNETGCRITGVRDIAHLRASHINPWSKSNDSEKLNGCNGLLLAPHIDHLFDSGNISFADDGTLLVSPTLQISILYGWGIDPYKNVGKFNAEQIKFLEFHRSSIFKQ